MNVSNTLRLGVGLSVGSFIYHVYLVHFPSRCLRARKSEAASTFDALVVHRRGKIRHRKTRGARETKGVAEDAQIKTRTEMLIDIITKHSPEGQTQQYEVMVALVGVPRVEASRL